MAPHVPRCRSRHPAPPRRNWDKDWFDQPEKDRSAPEALDIDGSRVHCVHLPCYPVKPGKQLSYKVGTVFLQPVLKVSDKLAIVVVGPGGREGSAEEE